MGRALARPDLGTSSLFTGTSCVSPRGSGSGAAPHTSLSQMTSPAVRLKLEPCSLEVEQEVPARGAFVLAALVVRQRNSSSIHAQTCIGSAEGRGARFQAQGGLSSVLPLLTHCRCDPPSTQSPTAPEESLGQFIYPGGFFFFNQWLGSGS